MVYPILVIRRIFYRLFFFTKRTHLINRTSGLRLMGLISVLSSVRHLVRENDDDADDDDGNDNDDDGNDDDDDDDDDDGISIVAFYLVRSSQGLPHVN